MKSPVGLVPKAEAAKPSEKTSRTQHDKSKMQHQETRLVFNLSWLPGTSINDYTPRELCTVKYKDLNNAVQLCLEILNDKCNTDNKCYLAKTDIKSAFRHLPIRPQDWRWLVLMARHPISNEKYYFIDKVMPFGSGISCANFQRVSDGLQAIFQHGASHKANNYLDDFLFATYLYNLCNQLYQYTNLSISAMKSTCQSRLIKRNGLQS